MKRKIFPALTAFALVSTISSTALAEWTVKEHPLAKGYRVVHDSGDPGLVNNTTYKTKKAAEKAAKTLNAAEKDSEGGHHEV